jgi:thioredoxin reductase (NADPH)
MANDVLKTVIIGSGPAGLTAAIYAARANLNPVVLAGKTAGGQLTKTSLVENFPGFKKGIMGPELMMEMMEQAQNCGAKMVYEAADAIDTKSSPISITYGNGQKLLTHTLIFATGAAPRLLGLPGEHTFSPEAGGFGFTTCAVCDGNWFKNMPVAVIGGGDSAMEEATYLAKLCASVTVIHRREVFRASKVMIDRAHANPKIKWELNQTVVDMIGDNKAKSPSLTGLVLKSTADGSTKQLDMKGMFVAIGHIPSTGILKGQITMDEENYIIVNDKQETNVPGVYGAGDCHDRRYRQAITAAGMGCKAALEVERYLTHHGLA